MDAYAFPFHSSEPCHLSLCELVDGCCKLCAHLLVCQFSDYILCNEFVFETVVYKILGRDRSVFRCEGRMCSVDQPADFFHHSFFQSRIQAFVDLGVSHFAADEGADVVGVLRKVCCALYRMFRFIYRYFQGTDEALAGVVVCVVVKRFQCGESADEFFVGVLFEFCPEFRVRRYFGE